MQLNKNNYFLNFAFIELYPHLIRLPKLKYGTVLERPELYEK